MKAKFKNVGLNYAIMDWLNSNSKENWHFKQMEPLLCFNQETHSVDRFIVSATYDPARVSMYKSKFIYNSRSFANAIGDLDGRLSKCGFELLDYKHTYVIQLSDGRRCMEGRKGYLCLWGMTMDSSQAAVKSRTATWILEALMKEKPEDLLSVEKVQDMSGHPNETKNSLAEIIGEPNSPRHTVSDINIERKRWLGRIVELEKAALREMMGESWDSDIENVDPDIGEIGEALWMQDAFWVWQFENMEAKKEVDDKTFREVIEGIFSLDFVENVLWHIEGNLLYHSLYA